MGCFSGRLMSSAREQKLFCELCSAFNCSFDEFVGETVVSPSYSSAILAPPPAVNIIYCITRSKDKNHVYLHWLNTFAGEEEKLHMLFSVTKLCLTLCDPMDCSTPGSPVLHYLPDFAQTHVCWVTYKHQKDRILCFFIFIIIFFIFFYFFNL